MMKEPLLLGATPIAINDCSSRESVRVWPANLWASDLKIMDLVFRSDDQVADEYSSLSAGRPSANTR